jgi:hypothetical protein
MKRKQIDRMRLTREILSLVVMALQVIHLALEIAGKTINCRHVRQLQVPV